MIRPRPLASVHGCWRLRLQWTLLWLVPTFTAAYVVLAFVGGERL